MTTFISYSRANSGFVIPFVRDLKSAGFDIWLDQLDIPKGSRWDDEIEKALETSNTFIIVLSPESIESQNVKDEVGYAIDNGKHLLPLLLKSCKIPFRLRRFQFVDFTNKSYQEGLIEIKELLTNTKQLPTANDLEDKPVKIPSPIVTLGTKPPSVEAQKPESKHSQSKLKAPAAIALAGIALVAVLFSLPNLIGQLQRSAAPTSTLAATTMPATMSFTPTITATSTPTLGIEATLTRPVDHTVMLYVPAGTFTMGSDKGGKYLIPHKVTLSSFWIDRTEVSNEMFINFLNSTKDALTSQGKNIYFQQGKIVLRDNDKFTLADSTYAQHPVVMVSWFGAQKYCEWAGAQLPTEAQWEYAARGTDGRDYPWKDPVLNRSLANYNYFLNKTAPVESFQDGKSPFGVLNMAGNVWEWVNDYYDANYYQYSPQNDPPGPSGSAQTLRVIRGGGWENEGGGLHAWFRDAQPPDRPLDTVGFRCAKDASQ